MKKIKHFKFSIQHSPLVWFFVIILFIVCFGSCKKNDDKTIIISGKIYDPNFKSYVPAVKVRIASSKISSGIYSSAFTDIATIYSDNNGSYSFSLKKETVSSYKIYISKSKYFDYEQEIFPDNLSTDNDNSINLNIFPIAFIKYRLKNTTPFSPEDMVVFQVAKDNYCSYCCPLSSIAGYGMNYDTTFSCKSRGQQNLYFSWHYLKNKIDINKDSSIFCKAFDTTYCFIRY